MSDLAPWELSRKNVDIPDFLRTPEKQVFNQPSNKTWDIASEFAPPGDSPETKALSIRGMGVQGVARAPATDPDALVSASRRNELVFACLQIKAMAATDPRLIVQRSKGGKWEEEKGHPFRRLMKRPNDDMDEGEFVGAAITSWDIDRRFYAEIVRSGIKAPVQLHPLDPTKVREIKSRQRDGSTRLEGYEWRDGSYRAEIETNNMLVRKGWGIGGRVSPTMVVMGAVEMDTAQTDFIRAFFRNGGVPSGLLKYKNKTLNPQDVDKVRAKWKARFGTFDGLHDIGILDADAEYQKVGTNLDELDSDSLRALAESRICMAYGVPPLIVYAYIGLLKSTYSNLKYAWAQFWDTTMSPLLKQWRSFFEMTLLTEFVSKDRILDEEYRLAWDFSEVAAMQEDVDAIQKRAAEAFKAGGILLNEYRAKLGEEPETNGDYRILPAAGRVVLKGQDPNEAATEAVTRAQEAMAAGAIKPPANDDTTEGGETDQDGTEAATSAPTDNATTEAGKSKKWRPTRKRLTVAEVRDRLRQEETQVSAAALADAALEIADE